MTRSLGPLRLFIGLVLIAGWGCVSPVGFTCDQQYQCPSGYVCDVTGDVGFGRCETSCPAGTVADGGFCLEADAGSTDAGVDAGTDAGVDAGEDAGIDAGTDAGADAGVDAGIDAGSGGGIDAGVDAGIDAGADAGPDAGTVAAPSGLSYSPSPLNCTVGAACGSTPSLTGGGAVEAGGYSISPALPAGLSIDSTSGVISGTPTAPASPGLYTVTAGNSGGSTTAGVPLSVNGGVVTGMAGSIVAGVDDTCALVSGGVQCWGGNSDGQLGIGNSMNTPAPAPVQMLTSGVSALAAGDEHSCAVVDGAVWCWGNNSNGQLGNNSTTNSSKAVEVSSLTGGVSALAAGSDHTCALVYGGEVECWGANGSGQLGNSSTSDSHVPVAVSNLSSGVVAITAGGNHTCALLAAGTVECWGDNTDGDLGDGSTDEADSPQAVSNIPGGAQAVAAGTDHTCAIVNGAAKCWGFNMAGQLGNGDMTGANQSAPVQVSGLTSGVQAITAGNIHTCAIVNGAAECWGAARNGQLGNGATSGGSNTPTAVSGLSTGVQAIVAGSIHTCALVNGAIECWGDNADGELGNPSVMSMTEDTPQSVPALTQGVEAIAAGQFSACAIENGGLQCWGDDTANGDTQGVLGDGSTAATYSDVPVQVSGLTSGVQAISVGGLSACSLVNGGVQCWGDNSFGELGDGSTDASYSDVPVRVSGLTSDVQAISVGYGFACALVKGGVSCWGYNGDGQLGDDLSGLAFNSDVPVQVSNLTSGVQAIASGSQITCALVNGGVQCWGEDVNDDLGDNDGSTQSKSVPVSVVGLSAGPQAISVGGTNGCALVSGSVQCWGNNNDGELGTNSASPSVSNMAVPVFGLTDGAQAVSVGEAGVCALVNGGVQCWGDNHDGQLGTDSPNISLAPLPVTGLTSGVQSIASGGGFNCALVSGDVQCLGYGAAGQLGDDSIDSSDVPVAVSSWVP